MKLKNKYYGYSIDESELADVKKICVIGWGLLGDSLMRITTIEAIKERFNDAEIYVIADSGSAKAFNNNPHIKEVIVISRKKRPIYKYISSMIRNILYLRKLHIDLCVNLYSGGSSARLGYLTGARIRLGFDHTPQLRKYNNLLVKKPSFCGKWVRALSETVKPIGIDPESITVGAKYYIHPDSRPRASEYLKQYDQKKVLYNLGGSTKARCWSVENFAALARKINEKYEAIPVLLSSPGQESLMEQFINQYKQYSADILVVPRVDFDIEAAIVDGTDLVITGDTGLKHLAAGLKKPIVGIYFQTRPENTAPSDVPYCPCYIEKQEGVDECGYPALATDIPVEFIYKKISDFVEQELGW